MENPTFELKTEGKDKFLVITCKLPDKKDREKSGSGKSFIYSSTNGNRSIGIKVDGDDLIVGLNAYTKVRA